MSYIGKNPKVDSVKLDGSAAVPSGAAVEGQLYYNTGAGTISEGLKVYKNGNYVGIDKQLGDADTLSLSKAMDLSGLQWEVAINSTSTTVGMNSPVPQYNATATGFANGSSTFSNSSTGNALLTNDSADIVFAYESHTVNSKNDYFGIQLDIPKAFRGQNLVLEFEYRTAEASGASSDSDFLVSIQDDTNKAQTTNSTTTGSQAAGTSVAVASSTGFAVGDFVRVESGTGASGAQANNFTEAYVTAIADSTHLTFSETIVFPASGTTGIIAANWLINENEGLLQEADSDTNKVGKKYSVQFKTEEDTAKINVSIQNRSTTTAGIDIFLDNILLSANKFLQASSQTKAEYYFAKLQDEFWDSTGSSNYYVFNEALVLPKAGTPPLADSQLITIADRTGPGTIGTVSAIEAKQKCTVTVATEMYADNSGEITIMNQDEEEVLRNHAPNSASAGYKPVSATVVLAKGDYLFFRNHEIATRWGSLAVTATPQTSDVILLESQDEIFTGWNEFTPVCGLTGGTKSLNKGYWRRVGSEMEVRISVAWSSKFTGGTATFDLPSGYSIDTSVIPTPLAANETDFGHAVVWDDSASIPAEGRVKYSDTNTVKATWLDQAQTTYAAVINPGGTLATQSGGWISTVSGSGGSYTIGFTANFFGEAPSIQVTAASSTHSRIGQVGSISSSTAAIYTFNASTGSATSNDVSVIHVTATRQGSDFENDEWISGGGAIGTGVPFTIADNDAVNVEFKVPIAGWNANFNPLLSLPLVDLGTTAESYKTASGDTNDFWDSGTGNSYLWNEALLSPVAGSPALASSSLITIADKTSGTNTVTAITAKQDIILTISLSKYISSGSNVGFYWGGTDTSLTLNQSAASNQYFEGSWSGKLQAGDYIYSIGQAGPGSTTGRVGGGSITAQKLMSGNMAHIIKPAVAVLSDEHAAYGTWGGDLGAVNTWHTRALNTVRGDAWFVTLNDSTDTFTLDPGTYKVMGQSPLYAGNQHKARLYNSSDSAVVFNGGNSYSNAAYNGQAGGFFMGTFTITSSKNFIVQHIFNNDNGGASQGGFDSGGTNSGPSVFTTVMIEKLK